MQARLDELDQFKLDVRSGKIAMERVRIASILEHAPSMGFYRDNSIMNPFGLRRCEYYDCKEIFRLLPPFMSAQFGLRCCQAMLPKHALNSDCTGKLTGLIKEGLREVQKYLDGGVARKPPIINVLQGSDHELAPCMALWGGCYMGGSQVADYVARMTEIISTWELLEHKFMNDVLIDVVLYYGQNWKPE